MEFSFAVKKQEFQQSFFDRSIKVARDVSFPVRVAGFSPLRFEATKIGDLSVRDGSGWHDVTRRERSARGTNEKGGKLGGDEETSIPL